MTRLLVGRVSSVRSKTMSAIRSKNTKAEKMLAKELKSLGLPFKRNAKNLPGKPDFVFVNDKVIVFCDGDFWHGRNWKKRKSRAIKVRREYWIKKIEGNIARDKKTNRKLRALGWKVLRVWETDLAKRKDKILNRIAKALDHGKSSD